MQKRFKPILRSHCSISTQSNWQVHACFCRKTATSSSRLSDAMNPTKASRVRCIMRSYIGANRIMAAKHCMQQSQYTCAGFYQRDDCCGTTAAFTVWQSTGINPENNPYLAEGIATQTDDCEWPRSHSSAIPANIGRLSARPTHSLVCKGCVSTSKVKPISVHLFQTLNYSRQDRVSR